MGNRMNSMQSTKLSPAGTALHSKDAPFLPILPFSTASDLGALYILGPELGRGQSGIIRRCTSRSSGTLFACKSISKLTCDVEDVVREVCIMQHLSNLQASRSNHVNSPHSQVCRSIVHLQDVIEEETYVHLIMELCSGGELFDRIKKQKCYPEAEAAFLMKSLLETLQYCHSMGVMHRDIKPENILLVEDSDTSSIKLADFGLALEFFPGQKFSGMAGSSYYMAPEVLQGEYSKEIDMWSVGVILHILLSGVPPFGGATEQRIFHAIQKGELSLSSSPWEGISALAKDLIPQILHPDAKSRLTPAQALKHPWIVNNTKNANVSSQRSSSSISRNQAMSRVGMPDAAKPELNKILVDSIGGMNRDTFSLLDTLAAKGLQYGWSTCFVMSVNGSEETVVVDMGQEKYLVSHDRIRSRIGWKLLKDKSGSTTCTPFTSS